MLHIAKWLAHDPARTRLYGRRAAVGLALLLTLLIGVSIGGNRSHAPADTQPLPPLSVTDEPVPSPLQPQQPPTTTADPTRAADTVTIAFLNAWLQAPVYENSKRGHAAWLAGCSPYVDGGTYGLLQLADKSRVPTGTGGKPLKVVRVRGIDQTGDVATLQATLSDGSTVTVTATGQRSGWRVSGYRARGA